MRAAFVRVTPSTTSEVDLEERVSVTKAGQGIADSDSRLLYGRSRGRFAVQDPDVGSLLQDSYNPLPRWVPCPERVGLLCYCCSLPWLKRRHRRWGAIRNSTCTGLNG